MPLQSHRRVSAVEYSNNLSGRILTAAILFILLPVSMMAQEKERMLKKESSPNEPVEIKRLKVKGQDVSLEQKFLADDDWLRGFTVKIKNISNQYIMFVEVTVDFVRPEDQADQPPLSIPLSYGYKPQPPGAPALPDKPRSIAPNETIELTLSDKRYEMAVGLLKHLKYSQNVKEAVLEISEVIFDDESMWRGGRLLRRDPNDPDRWNVIGPASCLAK